MKDDSWVNRFAPFVMLRDSGSANGSCFSYFLIKAPLRRSKVCEGNVFFWRNITLTNSKVSSPTPPVFLNWTSSSLLPSSLSGYESTTFNLRWSRSRRNSSLLSRTAVSLLKVADKDIICLMSNVRIRRLSLTSTRRCKWLIRLDRALHLLQRNISYTF